MRKHRQETLPRAFRRQWRVVLATAWPLLLFAALALPLELVAARLLPRLLPDHAYLPAFLHWATIDNTGRMLAGELDVEVDQRLGWRNRPLSSREQVSFDAFGARSNRMIRPATPRPLRVLLLGNSLVHGSKGVANHQTINAWLDSPRVETVNLASAAYQLDQTALAAGPDLDRFRPELLIVGLDTACDLRLERHYLNWTFPTRYEAGFLSLKPHFTLEKGALNLHQPDFRALLEDVAQGSGARTLRFLRENDPEFFYFRLFQHWESLPFSKMCVQGLTKCKVSVWSLLQQAGLARGPLPPRPDLAEALLARIQAEARARGVPLLFLLYPRQRELDDRHAEAYRRWQQALARQGIDYIDIRNLFNEFQGNPRDLYLGDRLHLSPTGNRYIAASIRVWMAVRGMQP